MWTFASSLSSQFHIEGQKLYSKTRQLLDSFESDTCCQELSIEHVQAWILLAIYELTGQNFHRGMVSAGRAFRLAHMMRLYELDIPPSPCAMQLRLHQLELNRQERSQSNWIETEVKRRTFWLAYLLDIITSMVDGMHMSFDERVVSTCRAIPGSTRSYSLSTRFVVVCQRLKQISQVVDLGPTCAFLLKPCPPSIKHRRIPQLSRKRSSHQRSVDVSWSINKNPPTEQVKSFAAAIACCRLC